MGLLNDLRLALRSFRKRRAFTATVVGTLALGIGATTAVFSLVYGVMIRPLAYPEPERLVNVYRFPHTVLASTSPATLVDAGFWIPPALVWDWQASADCFQAIGGYSTGTMSATIGDEPESVQVAFVTSGVFRALGVRPLLGAVLTAEDDRVGAPGRAVLSHAFWQGRFGGDRAAIGRVIRSGADAYTIVGVMPPGFGFPAGTEDLWTGLGDRRLSLATRKSGFLQVVARLKPDVTLAQARAAMGQLTRALAEEHPEDEQFQVGVLPRMEVVSVRYGRALLLLLGAVAVVLLIAAANVANLLLVRATERRREIGLRGALGAPRSRLVAEGLAESLLLSLAGGLAGCLVAAATVRTAVRTLPITLPRASEIGVDARVLLVGLALSLASGVLVGVLPALRSTGVPVVDALRDGGRVAGGRRRSRAQAVLVVTQVALVVVLLTVTGLFTRSLGELNRVDMGFRGERVLTVNGAVPHSQSPGDDFAASAARARTYARDTIATLAAIPGVAEVGAAGQVPTFGSSAPPTLVETDGEPLRVNVVSTMVTPRYFGAMGMPLVAGRVFSDDDREGTQPVAVVNRAFARRYWPNLDPIGRRVKIDIPLLGPGSPEVPWMTVVGVVGDVRLTPRSRPGATLYMPHAQQPRESMTFVLRTALAPSSLADAARAAVRATNRDIVIRTFVLADRVRDDPTMVGRRVAVWLLGGLAAIATLMALLGIYSLLAYAVARRTQEIGIRMALGASRVSVVGGVMRQGMAMGALGLVAGCACTIAAIRMVRAMLVVSPTDPVTLAAVGALVFGVVTAASFVPARRATKVDPIRALRTE